MVSLTTTFVSQDIDQAVRLASANYVDLITKQVRPYGPTSGVCKVQIETEVRAYLEDILYRNLGTAAGAIFLKDSTSGDVIGFTIFLDGHNPADCGLSYVVVQDRFRRKGLMKMMMNEVKRNHSFIGLSCKVEKVPYYESLGFRITGPEQTQVAMSWGINKPHPDMNKIDFDGSVAINNALDSFVRSTSNANAILERLGNLQSELTAYIESYTAKRFNGLSHTDSI